MQFARVGGAWSPPSGQVLWLCSALSGAVSALGTWEDQNANGNDCTLSGDAYVSATDGLILAGDDWGTVANHSSLDTSALTVCFWVYLDNVQGDTYWPLLSKRDAFVGLDWEVYFWPAPGNELIFGLSGDVSIGANQDVVLPKATWTHVAVTCASTSTERVKFYVDGSLEWASGTISNSLGSGDDLLLGKLDPAESYYMEGKLDDIQIFDSVLGLTDIQDIYNNSPGSRA